MKRILFIASMFFVGISNLQAQVAYEKAKFFDNVYLGVEGGASTNLSFNSTFPLNGAAGIKLGKNFSPVFGANFEGLSDMFYHPEGFNCLDFDNIWDEGMADKKCGFFVPAWSNLQSEEHPECMDSDGNTNRSASV